MTDVGACDGRSNEDQRRESINKSGSFGACGRNARHGVIFYNRPENNCKRK